MHAPIVRGGAGQVDDGQLRPQLASAPGNVPSCQPATDEVHVGDQRLEGRVFGVQLGDGILAAAGRRHFESPILQRELEGFLDHGFVLDDEDENGGQTYSGSSST